MKNIVIVFVITFVLILGSAAYAVPKVKFGGNLDRPTSTKDADEKESPDSRDEPPVPEEPEDEEEEEPPELMEEELEGSSFVLVLDRSGSMSAHFGCGFPVNDRNGNVVPSPNRWQAVQSEAKNCINAMTEEDTFDIITFNSNVYICFSMTKEASAGNKGTAIGWIYNIHAGGGTGAYNPLRAAYNNYGQVDTILFLSDGVPYDVNQTITGVRAWISRQAALYAGHKLMVIQIGGSPRAFMVTLGGMPNAEFSLK